MGLEHSGEPRQSSSEREHRYFVARGGDAHRARGGLVLADRLESVAGPRAADAAEDVEREGEREPDGPQPRLLGDGDETERAVRVVPVHEGESHHLSESDGGDGEEDAAEAEDGQSERHGEDRGQDRSRKDGEAEGRVEVLGEDRARVGADGHEARVGERELAAAQRAVDGEREKPVDPDEGEERLVGEQEVGHQASRVAA